MAATVRHRGRPVPRRSPALAHLSLEQLRAYRAELTAEEGRVSYWRRLVQARLDVVGSTPSQRGGPGGAGPNPRLLEKVLADASTASRRQALVTLHPCDGVPPLPDLAGLWATLDAGGADEREHLLERLRAAEHELSAYRVALHGRLDASAAELVARYHEDPPSCFVALPWQPTRRRP